jgi:hypothetical protein
MIFKELIFGDTKKLFINEYRNLLSFCTNVYLAFINRPSIFWLLFTEHIDMMDAVLSFEKRRQNAIVLVERQ